MKRIFILLASLASLAVAGPYPYTHDGFFLNFALGFGYQGLDYEGEDDEDMYEASTSGLAFDMSYRIGGRIAPFTVLHATVLRVSNLSELETEMTSNGKTEYISTSDYSASMFLYGVGVTYFIPPRNYYVSGSVGLALFTMEDDDDYIKASSSLGLGFQLLAGKEWWISENWGIGIAVAMSYGSADDKDDAGEMSAFGINFFITATYN
jgi:hypothetical protein